jgi:tRNA-splicing ligase RtcB (3'-phosphate/5'-hydroxy nucleic acid ligase)
MKKVIGCGLFLIYRNGFKRKEVNYSMAMKDFIQINEYEWEIPRSYHPDMQVPVRIFATRKLLEEVMNDRSIEQAVNSAMLPGLVGNVLVMPDMHQGYGFPIGGVAATRYPEGVISPGGIGYDINCGVRLLASRIDYDHSLTFLDQLAERLYQLCPSGVGEKGTIHLSEKELDQVLSRGSRWVMNQGMACEQDLLRTEENGSIEGADPNKVSKRAKDRGRQQLGTLGAGNHFLEVDVVEQVFYPKAAQLMGLEEGNLAVQIHCGSRGLGHQVCTDYVDEFQVAVKKYNIRLPDRELVCAPLSSPEGKSYLAAMRSAANYAFANRQVLAHYTRKAFEEVFFKEGVDYRLDQVYDIAHNIGKIETHVINGEKMTVCVHRKGATRAFGPGNQALPQEYLDIGQPVLVPGSMGTASWVLVGTEESMERSLGSSCHGAGRVMSRHQAKKVVRGEKLRNELQNSGIRIKAGSNSGLAEEAPHAYKDVDMVVETVAGAGLTRKVARLRPVIVIKG